MDAPSTRYRQNAFDQTMRRRECREQAGPVMSRCDIPKRLSGSTTRLHVARINKRPEATPRRRAAHAPTFLVEPDHSDHRQYGQKNGKGPIRRFAPKGRFPHGSKRAVRENQTRRLQWVSQPPGSSPVEQPE